MGHHGRAGAGQVLGVPQVAKVKNYGHHVKESQADN